MSMRHAGLLLLYGTWVFGQGVTHNPRELTMTKTVDGSTTIIHLLNAYSAPATAWIVECHAMNAAGTDWASQYHWADQELGLEGKPIGPGKEFDVKLTARPNMMSPPNFGKSQSAPSEPKATCDNFQVIAAVFADGSVSGDLTWINAIATERRKAYKDIAKATEKLKKAEEDETDQKVVIEEFVDWRTTEFGRVRNGKPAPNYGVSNSWSSRTVPAGRPAPESMPVARPNSSEAVPGATLWLLQEKGKNYSEATKALAEWRDRLGHMKAITETSDLPFPMSRMGGMPGGSSGPQPDVDLVSKPAPEFTLKDVDGQELALKDLRGKTVFLNFWATWCAPCRQEMPLIKSLHDEFKNKGLVVVSINLNEGAETARKYFDEEKYPFRNLLDPRKDAVGKYAANTIPKVVLIDKDGIVRYQHRGFGSNVDLRAEVVKLGLK